MVYVSPDGSVSESRPLSVHLVVDYFWSAVNFVVLFFQTLINPDLHKKGSGYTTDFRPPSGGGGGSGGGGQGPPRPPPRKRFGGFGPSSGGGGGSIPIPFRAGGCSGGSCGF